MSETKNRPSIAFPFWVPKTEDMPMTNPNETKTAHTPLHMPSTPTGIDRSSAAYECGCTSTLGAIDLCRLHRAAPELLKALEAIRDGETTCECNHSTDDCCNSVGEFCPFCIAETALAAAGRR